MILGMGNSINFIALKHFAIIDGYFSDTNFYFNWSEKYYHFVVVNFQTYQLF